MRSTSALALSAALVLSPSLSIYASSPQTPSGAVPVTSQTAPQPNGPTTTTTTTTAATTTTPMTKSEQKAQRKEQKRQEKAAKDNAKAAKDNSKALKAQDKATNAAEKTQQPQ